jgi:hypothetical protein
MMSKGDTRRPCRTSKEEENLRWLFAQGYITRDMFNRVYKKLKAEGKIVRK